MAAADAVAAHHWRTAPTYLNRHAYSWGRLGEEAVSVWAEEHLVCLRRRKAVVYAFPVTGRLESLQVVLLGIRITSVPYLNVCQTIF